MLRLTDIRLPLDHPPAALKAAILKKLGVPATELHAFTKIKRGHDARKKPKIISVYTIDAEVADEEALLARLKDGHVRRAPDMEYRQVARAPENFTRPLVIGAGPCGLFAGLILAQKGFRPIILERGKVVRERPKATWGLWRKGELNP